MELKGLAGERFLDQPDAAIAAVLIYGEDAGLVRERAERLVRAVAGDAADPFRVSFLVPEQIRDDPALLADETAALSMTGGRRVVRLRGAGNELAERLKDYLSGPPAPALLLVEAGALGKKTGLPRLFEAARNAAALACYRDMGEDLTRFIAAELRRHGLAADGAALEYLSANLGGDRALTRAEIEKLATYAGAGTGKAAKITEEDVVAAIGDSAAFGLDDAALAVGEGDRAALETAASRLLQSGTAPVAILRAVSRHFLRLHEAKEKLAAGQDARTVAKSLKPPVFWRLESRFMSQAQHWPEAALATALKRLLAAELECKSTGRPDVAICRMALLELAGLAPRQRKRA